MFAIFQISIVKLKLGRRYQSRDENIVTIKTTINKHHPDYRDGFRFVDDSGRTYMPSGRWSTDPRPTSFDLVKEVA